LKLLKLQSMLDFPSALISTLSKRKIDSQVFVSELDGETRHKSECEASEKSKLMHIKRRHYV
jgi:hypothetical protein